MRTFFVALLMVLAIVGGFLWIMVSALPKAQGQELPHNVAEVAILGEISPDMADHVAAKLIAACEEDGSGPILVVLRGPGGDITAGNTIIDAMEHCTKHPVNTLCIGPCESMTGIIFEQGKLRAMWPRAFLMLHNAYVSGQGSLEQVENQLRLWNSYVPAYERGIAARAGISYEQYRKFANDQWYVRADEAVHDGLADVVEK